MTKFLSLFFVLTVFQAANADSTSCYRFEIRESAERSAIPIIGKQTWCYQSLLSPQGSKFIYNDDERSVKPELSAIVDADGMVTHGSLLKGEISTHKVHGSDINPLPVPLLEPAHLTPMPPQRTNVNETIDLLKRASAETPDMRVQEGEIIASVPEANLPWRGFWWSYKSNALAGSSVSPLAKYDRYVSARTGTSPRVASWERTYHAYKDVAWEGHCNGWAASAVLRAEPKTSKYDQQSRVMFTVADQKGILAEEDYCAAVAFYGRRNYGYASNDPRDIYPAEFHKVLTYYIGQVGKVVAMDYVSSRPVDNHLVSGYTMNMVPRSANTFTVTANLTVHRYDGSYSKPPGIAPTYIRTYKYILRVDASGHAVGGSWLSGNPDFLWVPLSPIDCSSNNPRMNQQFTSDILNLSPTR